MPGFYGGAESAALRTRRTRAERIHTMYEPTSGPHPAPFWDRLAAMIIDLSTMLGAYGLLAYVQVLLILPVVRLAGDGVVPWPEWPYSLIPQFVLVCVIYAAAFRWRRTPGMVAMNLRLLDVASDRKPALWQAAVRAIPIACGSAIGLAMGGALLIAGAPHGQGIMKSPFFWIPFTALALYLATYLPMAVTHRRQSLWDILSHTRVVATAVSASIRSLPPPPSESRA